MRTGQKRLDPLRADPTSDVIENRGLLRLHTGGGERPLVTGQAVQFGQEQSAPFGGSGVCLRVEPLETGDLRMGRKRGRGA